MLLACFFFSSQKSTLLKSEDIIHHMSMRGKGRMAGSRWGWLLLLSGTETSHYITGGLLYNLGL
jgi:hypothetical protein